MVAGVLLTMRLLAEERQTGTMVLLLTAPINSAQVVIGKFLGAYGFLALITAMTLYMPALIQINGKVSWEQIFAGYVGLLSLGGQRQRWRRCVGVGVGHLSVAAGKATAKTGQAAAEETDAAAAWSAGASGLATGGEAGVLQLEPGGS